MRSLSGLGGAADRYATPGLAVLEDDWKLIQAQLTSAMAAVSVEDAQYTGLLGRIQQFARTGGVASSAVTAVLSTGEAQQLVARLLSATGLAVLQAKHMDHAYAIGDPRAISLGTRLVSRGRDAVRISEALALAASAVTHGTSGMGLNTAELTVIAGLLMAGPSFGASIPVSLLLAAAQTATGLNVDIGEALRFFGLPSLDDLGGAFQKFVQPTIDNVTKPLGWVLAVLAGAAAIGVVGYIGWNVYVARKAVRRVTGNRKRSKRQTRRARRKRSARGLSRYMHSLDVSYHDSKRAERLDRTRKYQVFVDGEWFDGCDTLGEAQAAADIGREHGGVSVRTQKQVRRNGSDVAQTILQQIGAGTLALLGAHSLMSTPFGVYFAIGRNPKSITKIAVTLDPSDTYTIQFWKGRGVNMKLVAEESDVYVDQLHSMIEQHTMLRTRL